MAKSLVLHIGDPKTGTSSIQEVLRHGMYDSPGLSLAYPEQLNSFPLANALSDPAQTELRAPRWQRMADWARAADADVAVVSAEQFFRTDAQAVKAALEEFLPELAPQARIVAYVRPHAARLVSAFMQRSKAGLFQGDMAGFFARTKAESLLLFAPRFLHWRDTFGPRFTLRPMIRSQLKDADVVADFLDLVLQGAPFALKGTVQANTSLPLEHLAALREVQAVLRRQKVPTGTRHAVGDHVNRSLARLVPGQGTRLQMDRSLYEDLRAYVAADAADLDAAFFDGRPLMAQALAEAEAEALPQPQALGAEAHFPPETVASLRQKARRLSAMVARQPGVWTQSFERAIGQRPAPADADPLPPRAAAHVARVEAVLDEIAALVAQPPAPPQD